MEATTLSTKELCARLVALAEHQYTYKLSAEPLAIWRLVCKEAAHRLMQASPVDLIPDLTRIERLIDWLGKYQPELLERWILADNIDQRSSGDKRE